MITIIKKLYRFFIKKPRRKFKLILNKLGDKHKCYVCGHSFNYFSKYSGGKKNIPEFRKKLNMVGSDIDNFGCPHCHSHDRERHLYMFFDKLDFWKKIPEFKILHFAPEKNLSKKIELLNPIKYIKADLNPKNDTIEHIDATNIKFNDNTFDFIICNHVLEHIPDYLQALKELFRVLKPNGIGILQTPYSKLLSENFEDKYINTDELRKFFYGEKDHFRIFSEKNFFEDFKNTGFILNIIKNADFFDAETSEYYGVNMKEDLVKVSKPDKII
ncbi:MAG: methyltransferase domain-containing protein [Bacteroidota bacterium]